MTPVKKFDLKYTSEARKTEAEVAVVQANLKVSHKTISQQRKVEPCNFASWKWLSNTSINLN